jgi:hypothetical protein
MPKSSPVRRPENHSPAVQRCKCEGSARTPSDSRRNRRRSWSGKCCGRGGTVGIWLGSYRYLLLRYLYCTRDFTRQGLFWNKNGGGARKPSCSRASGTPVDPGGSIALGGRNSNIRRFFSFYKRRDRPASTTNILAMPWVR